MQSLVAGHVLWGRSGRRGLYKLPSLAEPSGGTPGTDRVAVVALRPRATGPLLPIGILLPFACADRRLRRDPWRHAESQKSEGF